MMCRRWRATYGAGLVAKIPAVILRGEVKADEVYVVAGHKGHPAAMQKKPVRAMPTTQGGAWASHAGKGKADNHGRGWSRFRQAQLGGMARRGLIQRGEQIVLRMLPNVQQDTIKPIITTMIVTGATVCTDAYDIYADCLSEDIAEQSHSDFLSSGQRL